MLGNASVAQPLAIALLLSQADGEEPRVYPRFRSGDQREWVQKSEVIVVSIVTSDVELGPTSWVGSHGDRMRLEAR